MLTEQVKNEREIQKIKDNIQICEEAIEKSEKYERLSINKDWIGYLKDLEVLVGLHDREIKFAVEMIVDAPNTTYCKIDDHGKQQIVSSRLDWCDFIARHQIQKKESENWIKEPERILDMARQAREVLPVLKEKLITITDGGNNVEKGESNA